MRALPFSSPSFCAFITAKNNLKKFSIFTKNLLHFVSICAIINPNQTHGIL